MGSIVYNSSNWRERTGHLTYTFKSSWRDPEALQIVTFLTGFSGYTKGNALGYTIKNQNVQDKLVILSFALRPYTTITSMSFDVIIFDPFNPVIRFEYGHFTQTYLSSFKTIHLPDSVDGERRYYMAGLNGFVSETNTQFSLFS